MFWQEEVRAGDTDLGNKHASESFAEEQTFALDMGCWWSFNHLGRLQFHESQISNNNKKISFSAQ